MTIESLKAKQAAQLRKAEREETIKAALPAGYPWRVHDTETLGMWVTLEADRGPYAPTLEDVAALAALLPTIPMVKVSGGCTSFRPACDPHAKASQTVQSVAPFVLEAQGACSYQRETLTVRWFAMVAGALCRIDVVLPIVSRSGRLGSVSHKHATGRKRHEKAGDILAASYAQPPGLAGGLTLETGEPMAIAERVTWYRRSGAPGRSSTYFVTLGDHAPTLADLTRNLKGGI